MKNIILILVVIAVICSCQKKEPENENIVVITEENLPKVKTLQIEKVNLPDEYILGSSYQVYHDSILIITNDNHPDPYMLTLVNMNDWSTICSYFKRGNGPDELLSLLSFAINSNYLYLECYASQRLIPFNLDSALAKKEHYTPKFTTIENNLAYDYALLDDTTLLVTNGYYFKENTEFDTPDDVKELVKVNVDGTLITKTATTSDVAAYNLIGGNLMTNNNLKRIILASHRKPLIRIFDYDLNCIKQIKGIEPDDATEYYFEIGSTLFFKDYSNSYYLGYCCDDDKLFVKNFRTHNFDRHNSPKSPMECEKETSEIFQLDWDGNITARYKINPEDYETAYDHLSYCAESNTLYISILDKEGICLYKAKLE